MNEPNLNGTERPKRILFVFGWLVVGGEETEVRLLAKHLDSARWRIEVVACFRKEGMPDQTHEQLEALGVRVDCTPYTLSFEDTVRYLARKIPRYDIVVSCQNVADIYPALERLHLRPPLIEHGGLVSEALAGPKHLTTRYVGVCRSIRDAAAGRMPGREHHAVEIPSMVDLAEFDPSTRTSTRRALGVAADAPLVGWVGRLDRKKRVEDFIEAAAIVCRTRPEARFLVIGGPDAFMPDYAEAMRALARERGLGKALSFLGDREDVPALLGALDVFAWLSRGEGMPHVIAEAGAARLPVVATRDNGTEEQIHDGVSGLFVPHEAPDAAAAAILRLLGDAALSRALGTALRRHVESEYAVAAVVPQWERLFNDVLAEPRRPAPAPSVFRSFLQGGFECSTHRRRREEGLERLDLIAAIGHDLHAAEDYQQLAEHGIRTVRDGIRWHLAERRPGRFAWDSLVPMLRAARRTGTQVIWDVLHYGWPEDIDIWHPDFVARFARFAGEAAKVVRAETEGTLFFCPVNEISFFSWAGGDAAYLEPFANGRGFELKVQLARAAIAAMDAIWQVDAGARFVHCDPAISIVADPERPDHAALADGHHEAQFQAWDMLAGRIWPQLGGTPRHLDLIGVNYYHNNQWIHAGPPIDRDHALHVPFNQLLADIHARYGRPILVAETGIEGELRAGWFAHILAEVREARRRGVPVEGICLYPVANHPGWDNDRDCPNGLLSAQRVGGRRAVHQPLADELARARRFLAAAADGTRHPREIVHGPDFVPPAPNEQRPNPPPA